METINNIKQQIQALEQSKGYHHQKYLNNLNVIDEKIDRVEKQMERTKSHVKRDLLKRHIDWYEDEITKMDTAIEIITNNIDSEIQRLNIAIKSVEEKHENEKKSFEYNIQNIRKCCNNRSAASVFDALQSVANALEIIRAENRQT
jgi:predicted  nucleic acid-binding Zn-ribbon protein